MLKVDLPPYVDIGAIRVPQTLTSAGSSCKLALASSVGQGEKSALVITMGMNS